MNDDVVSSKKVAKPVLTIQIVHYCCSKCAFEKEESKVCPDCGSPMRIVEVVEKYGKEAEEYWNQILKDHKKDEDELDVTDGIDSGDVRALDKIDIGDEDLASIPGDEFGKLIEGGIFGDSEAALDAASEADPSIKKDRPPLDNDDISSILDSEDEEALDDFSTDDSDGVLPDL